MRYVAAGSRHSGRGRYAERNDIYFDGNAARRLEAVPERRGNDGRIVYSVERRRHIERSFERAPKVNIRRIRSAKTRNMTMSHLVALVTCMACMFAVISQYLGVRSDIQGKQYEIMKLNRELNSIRLSNEEEYDRIIGSVDIEEIKSVAMNELGMKYPDTDQIVEFRSNNDDYVRQYMDIPGEEK